MHRIDVKLLIELLNNSHREKLYFDDGWNFSVDRYNFKKIDDSTVEVLFSFEADLRRHENNQIIEEIPSEHTEDYQPYEADLEIIIDLLSLDSGYGLQIKNDSYNFSSYPINGGGLSTKEGEIPPHVIQVKVRDLSGIEKRFRNIADERQKLERIINGLRLYRHSLYSDEPGEKAQKLWSIIEQIYGEQKGSLLTKEELKTLKNFLCNWTGLDKRKKDILFQRVASTTEKGLIDVLSERIELMNRQGIISSDETREMLKAWHSKRSQPAHGAILPRREEDIDIILWEMESTVESLLYGDLYPKMIHYIVFKKTNLSKSFVSTQGKLLSKLSNGYFALPIRHDEVELYLKHLPEELSGDDDEVILISHSKINRVTNTKVEEVRQEDLDMALQKIIKGITKKLNG